MNGREFIELLGNGKKPIVVFEEKVEELEVVVDGGMRGRAIGFEERGDGEILIYFDLKEFEKYNVELMKPLWLDNDGVPCLKVIETNQYPEDGIVSVYWTKDDEVPFKLLEEVPLYIEYASSGVDIPYVEWLEKKLQLTPEDRMRELIVQSMFGTLSSYGSNNKEFKGMERLVNALFGEEEMKKLSSEALDVARDQGMDV